MVHYDRLKRCSDRDLPIWLTGLRHAVTTAVTHLEQEEEDEEEEKDADYLDNLYGDQMVNIPSQDSRALDISDKNSRATNIPTPDVKINLRERRRVRMPKALADYYLS